jgi:hypothetical protein
MVFVLYSQDTRARFGRDGLMLTENGAYVDGVYVARRALNKVYREIQYIREQKK